ncbi:hypothetical protein EIP86_006860 [Pleurotus ostreatoroseus]|nr:hypothetical protein EIP86_006860 [Pleurotus ostreatoroseus]
MGTASSRTATARATSCAPVNYSVDSVPSTQDQHCTLTKKTDRDAARSRHPGSASASARLARTDSDKLNAPRGRVAKGAKTEARCLNTEPRSSRPSLLARASLRPAPPRVREIGVYARAQYRRSEAIYHAPDARVRARSTAGDAARLRTYVYCVSSRNAAAPTPDTPALEGPDSVLARLGRRADAWTHNVRLGALVTGGAGRSIRVDVQARRVDRSAFRIQSFLGDEDAEADSGT